MQKSREEKGGNKQKFVGGTTVKLWPVFCRLSLQALMIRAIRTGI